MFYENLYQQVLINPVKQGADELLIVSGYGSAAMVQRHLREPQIARRMLPVRVVLGMTRREGLPIVTHNVMVTMSRSSQAQTVQTPSRDRTGRLECRYVTAMPDIHAKVYVWLRNNEPFVAFNGSANYSHPGFNERERTEVMDSCDAAEAYDFYNEATRRASLCTDDETMDIVRLYRHQGPEEGGGPPGDGQRDVPLWNPTTGEIEDSSGLNWGFGAGRPRDVNEAYIPLYREMVRSEFFPHRPARFTIITDDDHEIHASRGQGGGSGKGISTPNDNTVFGRYFRNRLGVRPDQRLTRADFERYGRTAPRFTKIDEDTFFMDFSIG